jgi:hypothetical protein
VKNNATQIDFLILDCVQSFLHLQKEGISNIKCYYIGTKYPFNQPFTEVQLSTKDSFFSDEINVFHKIFQIVLLFLIHEDMLSLQATVIQVGYVL